MKPEVIVFICTPAALFDVDPKLSVLADSANVAAVDAE
jgi:hypothetical protein